MKYFDKTFWKFTAWFLLILSLGIAALALSTDYLERNQTAGDVYTVRKDGAF